MIRASFARTEEACRLTLEGHATGDPLVCAAASALAYALAGYARSCPGSAFRLESGSAEVSLRRDPEGDGAFSAIQAGFTLLGKTYPQLVHVSHGGRAEEITSRP